MMVVVVILMLLLSSAVCADVDLSDFSAKLLQLTDGQLGIKQFQDTINSQDTGFNFANWIPNGTQLVEQISHDIDVKINGYIDALRLIQTAYNEGRIDNEIRLDLCCNLSNLIYDPRFLKEANGESVCHLTTTEMRIDQKMLDTLKQNLKSLSDKEWQYYDQYYGTEDGGDISYPARNLCAETVQFDPRIRPWYTTTLNDPRDIVILIDRSNSMGDAYSTSISNTKLYVAKNAAAALVRYLNANDRVAVLAITDTILYGNSTACFSNELAVGTDDNKNQLLNFINFGFGPDTGGTRAVFTTAFNRAKDLFVTTDAKTASGLYANSDKIIVLLTDANQRESCQQIRQLEMDLFNNTVNIFTMGIGDNEGKDSQKVSCLQNLTAGPRGAHGFVPYSDNFSDLRGKLPFYYNAFVDRINRTKVTFSPPFTDVSGLGLQTAACLPLFLYDGTVSGVACIAFSVDAIFREIVNFRLGQLSYGFVIDSRGRVILHRLLPRPTYWLDSATLLELTTVEISNYALDIEKQILSGQPGNRTVNNVRCVVETGESDLHGVTKYDMTATYFWHAIPSMNFYMGLVIIQNELQSGVTWTAGAKSSSSVFLSDELELTNYSGSCVLFNRSSLTDKSAVKLAPKTFLNPANYTERTTSRNDLDQLKVFLTVKGGQASNLNIKTGIRDVVAATSPLESIWLQSPKDDVVRNQNILSRYIGTTEGVYRRFPAVRIDKQFDPTIQPWYKTAIVHPNQISFTLPFLDYASRVPTISISKIIWNGKTSNATAVGVTGMDVTVKYLYGLLLETVDQCSQGGQDCFAIDVSGFVVIHKDFNTTLPAGSLHIAAREPAIASELITNSVLAADTCVNYVALPLTNRLFWKADVADCKQFSTCIICKIKYGPDVSTNIILVVKLPVSSPDSCACQNRTDGNYRCAPSSSRCQCPCSLSVEYDSCLSDLRIDPVTWKPCIPSATLLNQADVTSDKSLLGLPSCLLCSSFRDPQLCAANNCYWLNFNATCSSTAVDPAPATATIQPSSSSSSPASPLPSSNRATTLGLAIGLTLGVCLLGTFLAGIVFIWRGRNEKTSKRGSKPREPYDTPNPLYESINEEKASTGSQLSQTGSRTSLSHVTRIKILDEDPSVIATPSTPEISSQYLDTGAAGQSIHSLGSTGKGAEGPSRT